MAYGGESEVKGGGDPTLNFCLGARQIEPPIDGTLPASRGTATLTYDDADCSFFMRVQHDVPNPTGYRLGFAPAGNYGQIVYSSGTVSTSIFDLSLPVSELSPAGETELRNGFIHVEVLSEDYPDGEIRGQLVDRPCVVFDDPDLEAATGSRVGATSFRITFQGPEGDREYLVNTPVAAWNSKQNEYLVVWSGMLDYVEDGPGGYPGRKFEIFGQRWSSDGEPLGEVVRISDMGADD